jgi:hypothetical protein
MSNPLAAAPAPLVADNSRQRSFWILPPERFFTGVSEGVLTLKLSIN